MAEERGGAGGDKNGGRVCAGEALGYDRARDPKRLHARTFTCYLFQKFMFSNLLPSARLSEVVFAIERDFIVRQQGVAHASQERTEATTLRLDSSVPWI
jgi:hypothetical protein